MPQTGKTYTPEFKDSIIKAAREPDNVALVARQHGLSRELVFKWMRQCKETVKSPKAINKTLVDNSSTKTLKAENETLKKLLGEKDLELLYLRIF